jgi:hypothetical protein
VGQRRARYDELGEPAIAPGNFGVHITGRQYRVFFSFSPAAMGAQFVEFCRIGLA